MARLPRRSGGIGRRAGLKIRWCESTVSVRARPPVLVKFLQKCLIIKNSGKGFGENLGSLYTNYYTNALRMRVFHRSGDAVLHE